MITGHTRMIRWGADIVEFPPLRSSDNGWYYGYDGKSVGRGSYGQSRAQEEIRERRNNAMQTHEWRMPDDVEPKYSTYTRSSDLNVIYDHPAFGMVQVTWDPDRESLTLYTHPALYELAEATPLNRNNPRELTMTCMDTRPNHEVAADLWNVAAHHFPQVFDLLRLELPETVTYQADTSVETAERFTSYSDQKAFWYTLAPEKMEMVAAKRIEDFIDLLDALGHTEISVRRSYQLGSHDPIINAVTVEVHDPEQDLGHTVTFSPGGKTRVECGYIDDENRHLDYQKRLIAGWMSEQPDEFTEVTFD